jgi:hypothetical protein
MGLGKKSPRRSLREVAADHHMLKANISRASG